MSITYISRQLIIRPTAGTFYVIAETDLKTLAELSHIMVRIMRGDPL